MAAVIFWWVVFGVSGAGWAPAEGDESDYLARALRFSEEGWSVFADGYRPPLFPLVAGGVLAALGEDRSLFIARATNLFLVSLIPLVWWWRGTRRKDPVSLWMALLLTGWAPFYLLSYMAYAEALSLLLLNLLVVLVLRVTPEGRTAFGVTAMVGIALLLAALFYTKANNILVAVPVGLFLFLFARGPLLGRFLRVAALAVLTALFLVPWLLFLRAQSGEWQVTTTGGYNLLVGTGQYNFGMQEDPRAIHRRYFESYQERSADVLGGDFFSVLESEEVRSNKYVQNQVAFDRATAVWRSLPQEQFRYALLKVLHSQGFSWRGLQDYIMVAFFGGTVLASLLLLWTRFERRLLFLHWGCLLMGCVVAFVWGTSNNSFTAVGRACPVTGIGP